MKVKRNTLLLLACLVWSAAGFNILRIGLTAYPGYLSMQNYLLSILVFMVFQIFIFGKLVKKHTTRISAYQEARYFFLKFFDGKSFAIMAVMMTGGIGLRTSGLVPERFIAVFYTGLGASLLLAGMLFGRNYGKAVLATATVQDKTAMKRDTSKGGTMMKQYMNTALLYAIFAMTGGVFYREFTKFNSFTAKTTLSVVHTHYFLLGVVFFLLLLLLEKNFSFTNAKTRRVLAVYHAGLNLTAMMLVVRGVTQVLAPSLSSGMNAAISGFSGIGHILLGIGFILLLIQIRHSVSTSQR